MVLQCINSANRNDYSQKHRGFTCMSSYDNCATMLKIVNL